MPSASSGFWLSCTSASSRIASPVAVLSTTISFSRSVSMRLCIARSISAAPAITVAKPETGMSTNSPLASSSSRRVVSSTKPSIGLPPLAHVRERGGGVGLDRQDRVEPADREHLAHIGGEPEQCDLAASLLNLAGQHQQYSQPGAADVFKAGHVDCQMR